MNHKYRFLSDFNHQTCCHSLWCIGHGEARKVATGHGEECQDGGEGSVMVEVDGKVTAVPDIAEHQQRDEHHPGDNQCQEEA